MQQGRTSNDILTIEKFRVLTEGIVKKTESDRFLNTVQNLKNLRSNALSKLNIEAIPSARSQRIRKKAIF